METSYAIQIENSDGYSQRVLTLEDYERRLSDLIITTKKSWIMIFRIMDEVRSKSLHRVRGLTFTKWLTTFAVKAHIHSSYLWKIKKAGEILSKYKNIESDIGNLYKISPEAIITCDKVASERSDDLRSKDEITLDLLNQSLCGDVKINSLKEELKEKKTSDKELLPKKHIIKNCSSTKTLISALSSQEWFLKYIHMDNTALNDKSSKKKFFKQSYRLFSEFAVETGSTEKPRRLDALIVEDYTSPESLSIHGIEIKMNKNDLISDKKIGEYSEFCDYFWLAIPKNLVDIAKSYIPEIYGLIIFSYYYAPSLIDTKSKTIIDTTIAVLRDPKKLNPSMKEQAFMKIVKKLM